MLKVTTIRYFTLLSFAALLAGVAFSPADASPIQLFSSPRSSKLLRGYTRGTVGLHNIVGERDQRRNRCMGYGSASPDHQLDLRRGLTDVSLQVRSKFKDSTLVLKGPGNALFCADDSSLGKDAGMKLNKLPPGLYDVWVGAFDAGDNFAYTLSIR